LLTTRHPFYSLFIISLLLFIGCKRESDQQIRFSDGKYVLQSNDLQVEIDPNTGGRITSFRLGDIDMLLQKAVNKENYGSTLWPSPQNWPWPPPSTLDRMAYAASIQRDTLNLTSYPDPVTGLQFSKSFWINRLQKSLTINYIITNISNKSISVGPWEVTRVPSGGICFFPSDSLTQLPSSNLKSTYSTNGTIWFKFDEKLVDTNQKLFQGGRLGWLAHVNNGLLFVKQFPDITMNEVAPGQGEVEIFADEYHTYIELENHGAYSVLKPGECLHYPTIWHLKYLDANMRPEIFNQELIQVVNDIISYR
jgi:hypothetical protein